MTKPSITIEGVDDLRKRLRQFETGTADLKSANAAGAKIVERQAERIAPKRSGRLAGNIRSTGQARQGVVRAGGARVRYAGPIHFGWAARGIKPQPFLYDALDDRRSEVVAEYVKQINKMSKKYDLN